MPTFQKAPLEILEMASDLLQLYESHAPLLEHKVRIDFLLAFCDRDDDNNPMNDALSLHGQKALGIARKIPLKDRVMGRGDAEICLDGDWWHESASEEQQRALLDHELHHLALKIVKKQVAYDDIGRPQIRLRKHDVQFGWFAVIADRHGNASQEQIQARTILDAFGQYFFPQLMTAVPSKALKNA